MSKHPFTSIIIPVHNAAFYLEKCLAAVTLSPYPPYEIIVVDDASSNDSTEIAYKYGAKVLALPKQSGPAAARNFGAREARGDIFLFIDSDQTFLSDDIIALINLGTDVAVAVLVGTPVEVAVLVGTGVGVRVFVGTGVAVDVLVPVGV